MKLGHQAEQPISIEQVALFMEANSVEADMQASCCNTDYNQLQNFLLSSGAA